MRAGVREVDQVATALDSAAARLDELLGRERAFTADASHQLRTPLAALRIELEALQLRGESAPELPAALAQVDRLESTISTLLAVARDAPRNHQPTPLRELLDEAASSWHERFAARGRPLRVRIEDEETATLASAPVLHEILEVLLDNALRHGAGAVDLSIRSIEGAVRATASASRSPDHWPMPRAVG